MQPSPNRNRLVESRSRAELAHDSPKQLRKSECAQKELNLQPAVTNEVPPGRVLAFPPVLRVTTSDAAPPTEAESGPAKRNRTVTESEQFPGLRHKPFALENRPDLLEALFAASFRGAPA